MWSVTMVLECVLKICLWVCLFSGSLGVPVEKGSGGQGSQPSTGSSSHYTPSGALSRYWGPGFNWEAQPDVPFSAGGSSGSYVGGGGFDSGAQSAFAKPGRFQPGQWVALPGPQPIGVEQREIEPDFPPPPSTYIIQSSNGYQRGRFHLSESSYSQDLPEPSNDGIKGVQAPAQQQQVSGTGYKGF